MGIRQNTGHERVLLRQRDLPARGTDLVRWHVVGPSSPNPLRNAGHELGTGGLPLHGASIGQRLLRLERVRQAEEGRLSRPGRRSRVPQPDLGLLLVWVRETADPNARAANRDPHAGTLPSPTHGDPHAAALSSTANCDDDSYLDAHLGGYEHGHNAALSGATHRQNPCLTATDGQRTTSLNLTPAMAALLRALRLAFVLWL